MAGPARRQGVPRVLFVTQVPIPGPGGLERHVALLSRELVKREVPACVVARCAPGAAPREERDGVRIHRLQGSPLPARSRHGTGAVARQLGFVARLVAFLIRHRSAYDVVHVVPLSRFAEVVAVVAHALGKPVVGRVAVPGPGEASRARTLTRLMDARLRRRFDAVVAQTGEIERLLLADGLERDRIVRLPNPVDTGWNRPLAAAARAAARRSAWPRWPDEAVIAVTVGRLAPEKDVGTFLRALASMPPRVGVRGAVIGDGPERASLERLAGDLALGDRVRFAGAVPDAGACLQAADVFVLTSRYEGLSNALLEAMATGLPAVVTAVGGPAEVATEAPGVRAVTPGDVGAVRGALEEVARDAVLRVRAGAGNRDLAQRRYACEVVVPQYVALYQRLAAVGWRRPANRL